MGSTKAVHVMEQVAQSDPVERFVTQSVRGSQVASFLCSAAQSLPAVSWVCATRPSPIVSGICSGKTQTASPALWPGGGNNMITWRWVLGPLTHVTLLPDPLPDSSSSPRPSVVAR